MWVAQSPVYYFSHSVCLLMFLCLATTVGSVLFLADIFLHSPNSHMEMLCGLHSHESSAKSRSSKGEVCPLQGQTSRVWTVHKRGEENGDECHGLFMQ